MTSYPSQLSFWPGEQAASSNRQDLAEELRRLAKVIQAAVKGSKVHSMVCDEIDVMTSFLCLRARAIELEDVAGVHETKSDKSPNQESQHSTLDRERSTNDLKMKGAGGM